MKLYTKFFIVVALTVVLISCGSKTTIKTSGSKDSGTTNTSNTSSGKIDTTHSDEFAISEVYYRSTPNNCTKNDSNCTYTEIIFSKLLQGPAKDKINQMMLDSTLFFSYTSDTVAGKLTVNAVLDTFMAGYNSYKTDMTSRGYGADVIPWSQEVNTSIPFYNPAVIVYTIGVFSFLGGAHPNTNLFYYNFDWNTGNRLQLSDVLKPGFEKKLNELIVAEFRKVRGLKSNEPLNSVLFNDTLTYTNNFGISRGKLIFYYNAYDIAAYAYGPTDLEIPISAIQDYIINPAMFQ
ncbi:MAG TPA: RsiV family protein [Ignavibacteria bacterium]|nr:RsiV family protein [Ignavibacteria bacterium]